MDDEVPYPGPTGPHLLVRAGAAGVAVGFLGLVTGLFKGDVSVAVISAVWMVAWVAAIAVALRLVRRHAERQPDQPTS